MSSKNRRLTYVLGTLAIGITLVLTAPVGAENSTTIDQSTQPHLKSWSNIIPNAQKRFVVLGDFNDEAVLDRETGLVWERSPMATTNIWSNTHCVTRTIGGRKGWRLPSISELTSLIDSSVPPPGPTLPVGHPFLNVQASYYWSGSTLADNPAFAWDVRLDIGYVNFATKASSLENAWCVRGGGMNVDGY